MDAGVPFWACGMDEADLVPQPTINELLCASLGHRWPGVEEDLGLINFNIRSDEEVGFEPDKCGMCYETQFCNYLKFKYNVSSLDDRVFSQLLRIRKETSDRHTLPPGYEMVPLSTVLNPFRSRKSRTQKTTIKPPRFDFSTTNAIQGLISTRLPQALSMGSDVAQGKVPPNTPKMAASLAAKIDLLDGLNDADFDDFLASTSKHELVPQAQFDKCTDRRNLANLGSSCFTDVIVQLLANVTEFRTILQSGMRFKLGTGRTLTALGRDHSGEKHDALYQSLANLSQAVLIPGKRVDLEYCKKNLEAVTNLTTTFQFDANKNEATSFFDWVHEALNIVCDRSEKRIDRNVYVTLKDQTVVRGRLSTPLEAINSEHRLDLQEGIQLDDLQTHSRKHFEAFLNSGHRSASTELSTIQIATLYHACSEGCSTVYREFSYSPSLLLRVESANHKLKADSTISLSTLVSYNLSEDLIPQSEYNTELSTIAERARSCPGPSHEIIIRQGELSQKVIRVTNALQIFVINVHRQKYFEENPTFDDETQEAPPEHDLHLTRISAYQKFNMAEFCNNGPALHLPNNVMVSQNAYKIDGIIAIIGYSHILRHFIIFTKRDDGPWVCFNDLDKQPEYRDPFSQWLSEFVEHQLCYRRSDNDLMLLLRRSGRQHSLRRLSLWGILQWKMYQRKPLSLTFSLPLKMYRRFQLLCLCL